MANVNMEIGDIAKKCKFLLLDIEGTTTSIDFVKDKLFPYAEENVKAFLEKHWDTDDVKGAVSALRTQAKEDQEKSVEGFVAVSGEDTSKEEQIESLVKNVKWQMSVDRKAGPLKQLQGIIWKEGYDNGNIKGHVYDDVSPALELWRSTEGQKIYIYSSGSVQAQKLLFNKSLAGDMLPLIDGHFDTAVGAKQEAASYAAIIDKIGCKADEVLFLTDIVKEAEAARASGLHAALVSREGNTPLTAEASASFPVLHSLDQLAVTNKRKPDPQEEEVPAKVPKTDLQDDVKSATDADTAKTNGESEITESTQPKVAESEAPTETMEVEETSEAIASEPKAESAADNAMIDVAVADNDVPMAEVVTDVPTNIVSEKSKTAEEAKPSEVTPVENHNNHAEVVMVDAATVTERQTTVDAATETNIETSASIESNTAKSKSAETITPTVNDTPAVEVVETKCEDTNTAATETVVDKESKTQEDTTSEVNPIVQDVETVQEVAKDTEENKVETSTKEPVAVAIEATENIEEAVKVTAINTEPVVEEIENKTEKKETEVMETKVKEIETVSKPIENPQTEAAIQESQTESIEIKDITDDKQSLSEVTDSIEDVVPIVEEPSSNLEAEELQNAGDVLEKECDEILSKVQDVTNLDFIPVKQLHTITEEMETENTDSNDIVNTILDTEMELSMKPEEIGQNSNQEITDAKMDSSEVVSVETNGAPENSVAHSNVDEPKLETNDVQIETVQENNVEKMDTETMAVPETIISEKVVETVKTGTKDNGGTDSKTPETETETNNEQRPKDTPAVVETQESTANNSKPEAKPDETVETKVNGKANGDATVKLNGKTTQNDDINSRLGSENGKEKVNGSNGDSVDAEVGQVGDKKVDAEITEIKVKSVATDEVRTPIEQPVEA